MKPLSLRTSFQPVYMQTSSLAALAVLRDSQVLRRGAAMEAAPRFDAVKAVFKQVGDLRLPDRVGAVAERSSFFYGRLLAAMDFSGDQEYRRKR